MRLKCAGLITLVVVVVAMSVGLYHKSSYKDFNEEEHPMNNFAVAVLDDALVDIQVKKYREEIDNSNLILAVRCEDNFYYRFSTATQKVSVVSVFKGDNIQVGDEFEIARRSTNISLDEVTKFEGRPIMDTDFVNEMIPGKTYLVFLDRQIETYDEDMVIYIVNTELILSPIFCYEDITNTPKYPTSMYHTYVMYDDVQNSEFFVATEQGSQKLLELKAELLEKYPL